MSLLLSKSHTSVAYLQHIRVIPSSIRSYTPLVHLAVHVEVLVHDAPVICYIRCGPPETCKVWTKELYVITPRTKRQDYISFLLLNLVRYSCLPPFERLTIPIAVVDLELVDFECFHKLLDVLFFVEHNPWETATSFKACTSLHSEFHILQVDVVGKRYESIGEFSRIYN